MLEQLLGRLDLKTFNESAAKVPLVVMSFDPKTVKLSKQLMPSLPRAQLVTKEQFRDGEVRLEEAATYAQILGPDIKMLWSKAE